MTLCHPSQREEKTLKMSCPDSRSDPIGGSEPGSGCENIYWDSLPDFFFSKLNLYVWVWPTSYNRIKRTTTEVVSINIYTHLSSPIYKYKTVLLHLQIRARNLHVVNPYGCAGLAVCGSLQMSSPVPTRIKTSAKVYA